MWVTGRTPASASRLVESSKAETQLLRSQVNDLESQLMSERQRAHGKERAFVLKAETERALEDARSAVRRTTSP